MLSGHALRGDANRLRVQGAAPFLLLTAEKGAGGRRGAMLSLPPCHLPVSFMRSWLRLCHGLPHRASMLEMIIYLILGVSCLEAVPNGNKEVVPFSLCAVVLDQGISALLPSPLPPLLETFNSVWRRHVCCHILWVVVGI